MIARVQGLGEGANNGRSERIRDGKGGGSLPPNVYADDTVSGAETRKLVNRQRLLDAICTADRHFKC